MTTPFSNEAPMARRRIPSIIAVGVIFLVLGLLDVYRGVAPLFASASHLATDDLQVLAIGVAALIGGGFVLRGHDWARWLLAVWMLLHVVWSVGQPRQLIAHVAIFGCIAFLLFRPRATAYFRAGSPRGDRSRGDATG